MCENLTPVGTLPKSDKKSQEQKGKKSDEKKIISQKKILKINLIKTLTSH